MKRIVITGGPCAGKTSALDVLKKHFESKNKKVAIISETASELIGEGIMPFGETTVLFHSSLVTRQIAKEDKNNNCDIMICDRGALDIKAYLTDEELSLSLKDAGKTYDELIDRYYAVFHLVTTAIGAEKFYTLENNSARTESVSQAAETDGRSEKAWADHPRRYIIDNSTDFDGKMQRLIEKIEETLRK